MSEDLTEAARGREDWAGGLGGQFTALAALTDDPSSVSSTYWEALSDL